MDRIEIEGSTFAHYAAPKVPNIGDKLCAPYLYFRFNLVPSSSLLGRCLVVGGGAIAGAKDLYRDAGYRARIVWAAGTSRAFGARPAQPVPGLLRRGRRRLGQVKRSVIRRVARALGHGEILVASSRDPGSDVFVPCVSCLHEVCDTLRGSGLAVIINENPDVSGETGALLEALRAEYPEVVFATNAMSEDELLNIFARTDRIITNSYHMTYWSLLSGGKVRVIGYSSKLESVLEIFGFSADHLQRYDRGHQAGLEKALRAALDTEDWLSLSDPDAVRTRFRRLNLDFAARVMQAIPDLTITPADHVCGAGGGREALDTRSALTAGGRRTVAGHGEIASA